MINFFICIIILLSMNFLRKLFGYGGYEKFMEAIANGDVMNTTVYYKKDFINRKNDQGKLPIHIACMIENLDIIKFLINNKCDTELIDTNYPPFHSVYKKGNLEIITYLLENKLGIEAADDLGMRPIHWACLKGYKEVVRLLIGYGCQIDIKTNDGLTPLDIASQHERIDCFNLIKSAIDIVPLIRDNYEKDIREIIENYEKIVKANKKICAVCLDNEIDCVLNCGHSFCMGCGRKFVECPNCRSKPTNPKRLYLD